MTYEFWALSFDSSLDSVLKPALTIPDSYLLLLGSSDNFKLHEVLSHVPPVMLLDVHIEDHLEVLTSYQPILGLSSFPDSYLLFLRVNLITLNSMKYFLMSPL